MALSGHLATVLLLLLPLLAFDVTWGGATLWMRFVRFHNPGGKGDNGHCCDGRSIFCPSKCDHRFVICLDSRYGRPYDTSNCPYGKKSSGEVSDQDNIVFGNSVGGLRNPMLFDIRSWPGEILLKIGIWDRDDNSDDFVDSLRQTLSSRPARSRATARTQRFTVRDRVSLIVDIMLFCKPDSYGRTCSVTCVAKDDVTAGYTCDPFTGRKICSIGWSGQDCEVSEDDCVSNRCQHGATCVDGHLGYTCVCAPGYTGMRCEKNIDECLSLPCLNNGTCNDDINGFTCTCQPQWSGVTCQVRDLCSEVTCSNGGTCFNVNNNFTCKCPQGFAGRLCELNVDECLSAPCLNDGACSDLHGAFHCTCTAGWTGVTCETDIDECASNPCVHATRCQNLHNDFSCVCDMGFTGQRCDTDINECLKRPCHNGGNCTNQEPGFQCACPPGFYGDTCEHDVIECAGDPCSKGSTCVDTPGSFYCLCPPDFTGPTCDIQIDDCLGQVCEHNGTCLDGVRDFLCVCTPHFTGRKCGMYLDRCLATPCRNGATCRDLGYGHDLQCTCSAGWEGSRCDLDEDECLQDPCANGGQCVNLAGAFACRCPGGWSGPLCQQDVDECRHLGHGETGKVCDEDVEGCEPPPCSHNAACVNTLGGFHCRCPLGWQGENCGEDVDECQRGVTSDEGDGSDCFRATGSPCPQKVISKVAVLPRFHPACENGATCLNTQGSYSCVCPPGWTGPACHQDIDECAVGVWNVNDLHQLDSTSSDSMNATGDHDDARHVTEAVETPTTSSPGSARSSSAPGAVSEDRTGRPPDGPCFHGAVCQNTAGSFLCRCPDGWSGPRCQTDVDECQSRRPCQNGGTCSNSPGSFRCACPQPWEGELCSDERDECLSEPCQHNGTCVRRRSGGGGGGGGGGVHCVCRRGWRGARCQEDRNECRLTPCLNGGTCLNQRGSFRCVCPQEALGRTCSNDVGKDKELRLPLYLQGHLGEAEEGQMTRGIQVFMLDHGDFTHDLSIRVLLRTHRLTVGRDQTAVTSVMVMVVVENVTLTEEEVEDILNRVPLHMFETYLPLPLFTQEVGDYVPSGQSRDHQEMMAVPWYAVALGAVAMAVLTVVVIFLVRRRGTVRWWPRRRTAHPTVAFSQNGNRSSSVDAIIVENEYVITQPDLGPSRPSSAFHPTDPPLTDHALPPWPSPSLLPTTSAAAGDRPRSGSPPTRGDPPGSRSRSRSGSAARSEVVWSRPKEVLLRHSAAGGGGGGWGGEAGAGDAGRERRRASSRAMSLARPATEEGESHCYINTVYMTIPDSTLSALPTAAGEATLAEGTEEDVAAEGAGVEADVAEGSGALNHLPPNPHRGALPPLPPAREGI